MSASTPISSLPAPVAAPMLSEDTIARKVCDHPPPFLLSRLNLLDVCADT